MCQSLVPPGGHQHRLSLSGVAAIFVPVLVPLVVPVLVPVLVDVVVTLMLCLFVASY